MFEEAGLHIVQSKRVIVTKDKIISHYKEVIERLDLPHFQGAILDFFEGEEVVIAIVESTVDTVSKVRTLIGATDPKKAAQFETQLWFED